MRAGEEWAEDSGEACAGLEEYDCPLLPRKGECAADHSGAVHKRGSRQGRELEPCCIVCTNLCYTVIQSLLNYTFNHHSCNKQLDARVAHKELLLRSVYGRMLNKI